MMQEMGPFAPFGGSVDNASGSMNNTYPRYSGETMEAMSEATSGSFVYGSSVNGADTFTCNVSTASSLAFLMPTTQPFIHSTRSSQVKELKDTVKQKNRGIKRLEMLLGQSSADLQSVSSNETGEPTVESKKSKKRVSKSPKHRRHKSSPTSPSRRHHAVEATNFSFSPTDVGDQQTIEESNHSIAPPADLSPALIESRKSIAHLQEEEKKFEEREEEAIYSIEHEIEELEARVAIEDASQDDGDGSKVKLEQNAKQLLNQKKIMLKQKTELLEQQHLFYEIQMKQKQQEQQMLQMQQDQAQRFEQQVSVSAQTSPTHASMARPDPASQKTSTASTRHRHTHAGHHQQLDGPASPESGGFSVSSSSLDMDHMEDDYSESTWNDIPISDNQASSWNVNNNNSSGNDRAPMLNVSNFGPAGEAISPTSPDLPPGVISRRIRTASGNDLFKDVDRGAALLTPPENNYTDPPSLKVIEKVEIARTPLRGNIRPKDREILPTETTDNNKNEGAKEIAESEFEYGFRGNDGKIHPMSEHRIVPTAGQTVAPKQPSNDQTTRNLALLQDQVLFLQSEVKKTKAEHIGQLNHLELQIKERDMLLEEVVIRIKRSNKEKLWLKEKLEKMEAVYDSNVLLKGLELEGFNFVDERPRTSNLLNIDFTTKTLSRANTPSTAMRPSTAGQYFKPPPVSAIGTNQAIYLKKAISQSAKTRSIRSNLRKASLLS